MAYSRRAYKGAPVSNALGGGGVSSTTATTITLASAMSGWSTSGTPFFIVIAPGTANEEKVCVIYATTTTLTVVDPAVTSGWTASSNGRGIDDTTARVHSAGAVVYPVFTATEANQANELVSKYTTNGDIVVHGSSGPKTISTGGSGNNNKVLVADSTVSDGGVKWASVTTDMIADGTIVNADISGSAAIALSKLATGALPTDITVASANLVNGTVALADLATAVANALVPVGTIAMYGGASAPTGWLLCDGTATTGYTALAAIVGGTTPDLRGRFAIGDNASLTLLGTGGSTTIGTNNLPSHSHANTAVLASGTVTITDPGHEHTLDISTTTGGVPGVFFNGDGGTTATGYVNSVTTGITASVGTAITVTNANTGGGEAYYQPYLAVNYIIKHD